MSENKMSSRERMLAALNHQAADHTPCSFMLYKGLQITSRDYADFVERQIEMGLDAYVMLPPRPPVVVNDHYNLHGLDVSYDPQVEIEEWAERRDGEQWPILVKEYHTPAGSLRAEVQQTDDWRWGDHVPFLDDYIVSRSRKFLVTQPDDLDALRYLMIAPTGDEVVAFRAESQPILNLARQHDLLVTGGWGVGADMVGWIYGLENMIYASYSQPGFMHEMLDSIAEWNRARMMVLLDYGIDLYIKRAWYETTHFWSPEKFRELLFPILKADADLAHQAGTKFGYIVTSGCMPLLELYAEAGVDVLIGVDPMEWDMAAASEQLKGRVCLWGGVNGHLTVSEGSPDEVRAEARRALEVLAPGEGFILSPVDNVREDTPRSRENVIALIDEWKRLTGQ
jgi:uroporphyrinogen-III decarboxylase